MHANASPLDHKPLGIFQVLFPIIGPQHACGKMQCPSWDLARLKRTDLHDCHRPDLALRRLQKTHSAHTTTSRMVLTEVCASVQGLLFGPSSDSSQVREGDLFQATLSEVSWLRSSMFQLETSIFCNSLWVSCQGPCKDHVLF